MEEGSLYVKKISKEAHHLIAKEVISNFYKWEMEDRR